MVDGVSSQTLVILLQVASSAYAGRKHLKGESHPTSSLTKRRRKTREHVTGVTRSLLPKSIADLGYDQGYFILKGNVIRSEEHTSELQSH